MSHLKIGNTLARDTRLNILYIKKYALLESDFLSEVLNLFVDTAYLFVKTGKMVSRIQNLSLLSKPTPEYYDRPLWVLVSALCSSSISLLSLLPPHNLQKEMAFRSKCLDLYGLSLGRLYRFYEAHRHLNEAESIHNHFRTRSKNASFPVTDIRRAEVYILEAIRIYRDLKFVDITEEDIFDLYRQYISKLDEAYICLEKVGRDLAGSSRSILWWGRYYLLKLRLFSVYRYFDKFQSKNITPIMFHENIDYNLVVEEITSKGLYVSLGNPYRKLCFIEIFLQAYRSVYIFCKRRDCSEPTKLNKIELYSEVNHVLSSNDFFKINIKDVDNVVFDNKNEFRFYSYQKKLFDKVKKRIEVISNS